MNKQNRFSSRTALFTPFLALLIVALGGVLGLAVLASDPSLGASFQSGILASLGELLLPLAGLTALALISVFDPFAGMLLWLLLAPYGPHIPLDISLGAGVPDLSVSRVLAGWLVVLIVAQAARRERLLRPLGWPDLAYLLFAAAMLLTASQSRWGSTVAYQAIFDAYLVPFAALYLARQLVRGGRQLHAVAVVLLLIGVALAFLVIREQLTGEVLFYSRESAAYSRSFRKVISLMGNAAPMGVTTAMTLPLGVVTLVHVLRAPGNAGDIQRKRRQKVMRVALLVCALAFISLGAFMTYNRATWLGMAITVLVFIAMRPAMRRLLLPLLVIAVVLAVLFWPALTTSPAVTERLLEDNSIDYRTTAAELAFEIARGNPLLGVGYGNFGFIAYETYGWRPFQGFNAYAAAHNSYLFILVSAGLIALVPYLAWLALLAREGLRRYLALRDRPRQGATPSPPSAADLDSADKQAQRDWLAAGVAMFLAYVLASGTFDNAQTAYMNLIFYAAIGAIWGRTERPTPVPAG